MPFWRYFERDKNDTTRKQKKIKTFGSQLICGAKNEMDIFRSYYNWKENHPLQRCILLTNTCQFFGQLRF